MMLAAKEMAVGIFREPCFWGQSYNTMLESLSAVPLLWIGASPTWAVQTVTACMGLFPYLLLSALAFRRKEHLLAALALVLPLCLTVEYEVITSMPRGWVTGIFLASFGFFSYFYPDTKKSWVLLGFSMMGCAWINPNGLYLSMFIGLSLWLRHGRNLSFYVAIMAGGIWPAISHYLSRQFYITNPGYDFHGSPSLSFRLDLWLANFGMLDNYFRQIGLFAQTLGWITFFLSVALICTLFAKGHRRLAMVHASVFLVFIISLGIEKVSDSHAALFFTGARFFLAVPLWMVFLLADTSKALKWDILHIGPILLCLATVGAVNKVVKLQLYYPTIEKVGRLHWVSVDELGAIANSCERLLEASRSHDVSLIVFESDEDQLLAYGCPCLLDSFPPTLFPWYERRTWRLKEEEQKVRSTVLFVAPLCDRDTFQTLPRPTADSYLLQGNREPSVALLRSLEYKVRPY